MRRGAYAILLYVLVSGCEEPFPIYEEPEGVLSATMARTSADTLTIVQDSSGKLIWVDFTGITLFVCNEYTQLLQGEALILGDLNFVMVSPIVRVFDTETLSQSHVIRPPVVRNTFSLTPGDSAELRFGWMSIKRPADLEGVPFTETVTPDGTTIRTYASVRFAVEGKIRLFERVQAIAVTPIQFVQTYVMIKLP